MTETTTGTNKITAIFDLIRIKKQYGTLLLLWPTLWSLVIASKGNPDPKLIIIFIAGAFLMRSAGCAINDVWDRQFDRNVERTKNRPIADGRLTVKEGIFTFLLLLVLSFMLVLQLNKFTIMLSFVAFILAAVYPLVKRYSHFPQAFLGMAFGFGAIMAWTSVTGSLHIVPFLIFGANILWSMAYDTVYALMDIEDDKKIGVKSTAIFFGSGVFPAIRGLYLFFFLTLLAVGVHGELRSGAYFMGLAISFAWIKFIMYHLEKNNTRENALKVFIQNALMGGVILAGIVGHYHLKTITKLLGG